MSLPFTIYLALAAPASDLETKVQKIFEDNCTACHGDGGEAPNLEGAPSRLTSVKSKETGKPMVTPGDPDKSYVFAKILGKNITGDVMPLGGDPLSAAQKKAVKDWIASLAPTAEARVATADLNGPVLDGLRVLDLTRVIAGPVCITATVWSNVSR